MGKQEQFQDGVVGNGTEEEAQDAPQVFTVQRDLSGWQFNRRNFLKNAATGAAGVVGLVACKKSVKETPSPTPTEEIVPTEPPTEVPTDTPQPTPTPTSSPTATPTATETPTPTDTITPTPSPEATPSPTTPPTETATATAIPAPAVQFITDVTIPDGTSMQPGQSFTKTWRVKNSGSRNWGEGTQIVFVGGTQMNGASPTPVGDVAPGDTTDISVDMVAPSSAGNYKGSWQLQSGDGAAMMTLTVVITVGQVAQPGSGPEEQDRTTFTGPGGETRWLPCGSEIPPGWTCTCNCVEGCSCVGHCACDNVCSCDQVCTCDTVCTCEGHGHYWHPC